MTFGDRGGQVDFGPQRRCAGKATLIMEVGHRVNRDLTRRVRDGQLAGRAGRWIDKGVVDGWTGTVLVTPAGGDLADQLRPENVGDDRHDAEKDTYETCQAKFSRYMHENNVEKFTNLWKSRIFLCETDIQ